jgi:hypothetical protein
MSADNDIWSQDAEARIQLLRDRADEKPKKKKRQTVEEEMEEARMAVKDQESSGLPTTGGHINFFEDLEQVSLHSSIMSSVVLRYLHIDIHCCCHTSFTDFQVHSSQRGRERRATGSFGKGSQTLVFLWEA